MTIAGIICEYNPLHEGHVYHMNETRRRTGCDYIVCVMAGAFMQRGEPAFLDKFVRAECALRAGADAVVELPALYAVRPAELYARGGVDILRAVGADFLSFGSETDDLDFLLSLSGALLDESGEVSRQVREGLRAGKTLARARGEALARALGVEPECLNQPNLALAAEYLKRILETNAPMRPVCVKRTSPYHADEPSASASALRRALQAMQRRRLRGCRNARGRSSGASCPLRPTRACGTRWRFGRFAAFHPRRWTRCPTRARGWVAACGTWRRRPGARRS